MIMWQVYLEITNKVKNYIKSNHTNKMFNINGDFLKYTTYLEQFLKKNRYFKNDPDYDDVILVFVEWVIAHKTHDTLKTQRVNLV